MKLNLFQTNTTQEASKRIIARLKELKDDNAQHYFIVPDRFTLSFEREICQKVFEKGCINVDVVSFTRLATKLLGAKLKKCLSKEGTVILLNKVIMQNNDKLIYYKDLASYSFAKELFAAIASLRDSKISYLDLQQSLPNLTGVTKEKLTDIALIYSAYTKALGKNYVDTISRIDYLIDNVKNLSVIPSSHIYIYGFNIYSAQQLALIKEFIKHAKSVNIAYAYDSGGINHYLFIKRQMDELARFCAQSGIPYNEIQSIERLNPPFAQLHRTLFGYEKDALKLDIESRNKVVFYVEDNPYEEIRSVAKEINFLVKNKNYRYKDIAIVINDDNYIRIVKEIFTRVDIPYFADVKYFIKDSLAVRYINDLLEAVAEKFAVDKIFTLIHSPLCNLSRKEIECFENYVLKYNINYTSFVKPFVLGDYGDAEKVRKKVEKLLFRVPKGNCTVSQYVEFVLEELSQNDIKEKLKGFLSCDNADLAKAADTSDFVNTLNEIAMLSGDNIVTLNGFINIINSALADMAKGVLPQYIDSVFVGNTTDSRFNDIKALFVVGASSGNFPKTSGDNVIISSLDSEIMKKNGLYVSPTPLENNNMERLIVTDLLVRPREKLYIGYSKYDVKGESLLIGEAMQELMHLMGVKTLKKIVDTHIFTDSQKLLYCLINAKNAYYEYIRKEIPPKYIECVKDYLIKKGYKDKLQCNIDDECNISYEQYLFKKKGQEYYTSVSQLESYFRCPYYHFMKYGLKLKEREEGVIRVNMVGNIVHDILEEYFKKYSISLRTATKDETKKRILSVIDFVVNCPEYDMYRADSIARYTLNNLKKEAKKLLFTLTEFVKQSSFDPTYIEMGFGRKEGDKTVKINVDDKVFNFTGKVDRVDTYGNKVAIIDYKTGSVEEKLKYVYYGKKIQLYLYLKVFLDQGYIPAGVFYMPIKSNYNKDGSSYKLVGQISNDFETFAQLDNNYVQNTTYESNMLGFKVKHTQKKGYHIDGGLSIDDFNTVCDYVVEISTRALSEICQGFREKKPLEGSCEYCAYKRMCGPKQEIKLTGATKLECFRVEEENK